VIGETDQPSVDHAGAYRFSLCNSDSIGPTDEKSAAAPFSVLGSTFVRHRGRRAGRMIGVADHAPS